MISSVIKHQSAVSQTQIRGFNNQVLFVNETTYKETIYLLKTVLIYIEMNVN